VPRRAVQRDHASVERTPTVRVKRHNEKRSLCRLGPYIEALVAEKTTPRNRSEAEIAGYRAVLDLIHENAGEIPTSSPSIRSATATDGWRAC